MACLERADSDALSLQRRAYQSSVIWMRLDGVKVVWMRLRTDKQVRLAKQSASTLSARAWFGPGRRAIGD